MRRAAGVLLAVAVVVVAGWAVWHWALRERADLPPGLPEAVRAADRVILYEGLPHQDYERDSLAHERAGHPVIELGGFPFYARPLGWRADDAKRLTGWLTDPTAIANRGAVRGSCGSFHPDYAVVWDGTAGRAIALVCLTCAEVRLFGPGDPTGSLYRLDRRTADVRNVLGDYREQRPPFFRFWENATR